jgi:hypothetical protein
MFQEEQKNVSNAADGEMDIAILTEGIVKDIVAGNSVR